MITTDPGVALSNSDAPPATARAWWWAAGAVAAALALAYAPNFQDLYRNWSNDPNYSHGFLVIPIAVFILWRRLVDLPWERSRDGVAISRWGWALLALVLAVRAAAYERGLQWMETMTLVPAITCLTWTFGGWPLLRRAWPSILFLVFMLPLPASINGLISLPLQRIAATGSRLFLQLSGFWVIQAGNVLNLRTPFGMRSLDVALACNGLRMLMTMAATVTATVILLPLPKWKRIALLLSAIPIALISNMIRIVGTGWCYYHIEGEHAKEWAHDISGWLMMPMALLLVGLELMLLSWLDPEKTEDEIADRKTIIPLLDVAPLKEGASGKDKGKKAQDEDDDRKLIFALLHEKASGKDKGKNADLGELAE